MTPMMHLLSVDEMAALADQIEASEGLVVMKDNGIQQLGIKRTAAVIAALRDRRKYSLLESQFANCHAEIGRLRTELLRYTASSDAT
jgi:hypothetical protein